MWDSSLISIAFKNVAYLIHAVIISEPINPLRMTKKLKLWQRTTNAVANVQMLPGLTSNIQKWDKMCNVTSIKFILKQHYYYLLLFFLLNTSVFDLVLTAKA